MSGLALKWNIDRQECELVVADPSQPSAALETAVLISIFSDRRAALDDVLPEAGADRRGWWADVAPPVEADLIGSRLWENARGKLTAETVRQTRDFVAEALDWLVADEVASSVTVEAERFGQNGVAVAIVITRPDGRRQRFDFVWERS